MGKIKKRPRGRPKGSTSENPASEKLSGVRVTSKQLEDYKAASEHEDMTFSAWVRHVLDKAAKRILK